MGTRPVTTLDPHSVVNHEQIILSLNITKCREEPGRGICSLTGGETY